MIGGVTLFAAGFMHLGCTFIYAFGVVFAGVMGLVTFKIDFNGAVFKVLAFFSVMSFWVIDLAVLIGTTLIDFLLGVELALDPFWIVFRIFG